VLAGGRDFQDRVRGLCSMLGDTFTAAHSLHGILVSTPPLYGARVTIGRSSRCIRPGPLYRHARPPRRRPHTRREAAGDANARSKKRPARRSTGGTVTGTVLTCEWSEIRPASPSSSGTMAGGMRSLWTPPCTAQRSTQTWAESPGCRCERPERTRTFPHRCVR
jgi:hypothetical protein